METPIFKSHQTFQYVRWCRQSMQGNGKCIRTTNDSQSQCSKRIRRAPRRAGAIMRRLGRLRGPILAIQVLPPRSLAQFWDPQSLGPASTSSPIYDYSWVTSTTIGICEYQLSSPPLPNPKVCLCISTAHGHKVTPVTSPLPRSSTAHTVLQAFVNHFVRFSTFTSVSTSSWEVSTLLPSYSETLPWFAVQCTLKPFLSSLIIPYYQLLLTN